MSDSRRAKAIEGISRLIDLRTREECENSLLAFSKYVWPVVEPAIEMVQGWVLEAICEHLEAVERGDIKRLLINVPPGFSKSLLTDVFFPAWLWGPKRQPWLRFLCAAYSEHLTVRDNMRCRNVIVSDRYQKMWKDRFSVSTDQFTKIKFANDQTGWKLATSVGGIATGERADIIIVDDPNNPMEMESEAIRRTTIMWFTEILPDRLNSLVNGKIVVIQQRTHEEDVSGIAISREMGYTHLMIPMHYDSGRHCITSLGLDETGEEVLWEDPRQQDGELAWPERFPEEQCVQLEKDKGPYAWAGQYEQFPTTRGGAIIKRDWWQAWKDPKYPPFEFILASLDTAYTEKEENDYSALTIWGVFRDEAGNPKIMLIWAWQERLEFHDLIDKVIATCVPNPGSTGPSFPVDKLVIEAKASGMSVGQELHRMFRASGRLGLDLVNPTKYGDKVARVYAIQHLFSDGMIYAPNRAFADDLVIKQFEMFPKGARDDLVDSSSMALRYLRDAGFALRREEHSVQSLDEMEFRPASANLPLYPV